MHIHQLKLTQFKNYSTADFVFSERLNCFVGRNGMGKTNLLDAIYYLCMCKSHRGVNDRNVVLHDHNFFRVEGYFCQNHKEHKDKIVAKVQPGKKKEFEKNDVSYQKLSEHIGLLPVVIIVPDDTLMATEGSEERRRFLDNTLSQLDASYLKNLITYNQVLRQRNATLKKFAETRSFDEALLNTYDEQLLAPAQIIFKKREAFVEVFLPVFQSFYRIICNGQEEVDCVYKSPLQKGAMLQQLQAAREKDRILTRTTVGIHKDDLNFEINGHLLRKFGSQGQLKSFVLALKLAQYDFLKKNHATNPILLMDDIFDKLDEGRVKQLIQLILEKNFGQVFITDTHENRVEEIIKNFETNYKKFYIEAGMVLPKND
ncbi:MAG: DNA replication/repair protein RecF [Bacteroidota bacterium]